jgi:hypothetical protein
MSAGGQRGIDVSGITGVRLQNTSDTVYRKRVQLVFQTFASTTGANAYRNETPNAYGSYIDFLSGRKEVGRRDISLGVFSDCSTCVGSPYIATGAIRRFRE